ncbi:Uncharacterised protein [uncultured archaeon]|nr:Uncharacterised protein [uncultured archaeon]
MQPEIRKDKREQLISQLKLNFPKPKLHFSGSTPPELFVGRVNYPNVFSGILSPTYKGDTSIMSSPDEWVEKNMPIDEVLTYRGQMIYGRKLTNIKLPKSFHNITQELALSSKPVSMEFFLKKAPVPDFTESKMLSIMAKPAPIEKVILEENPRVDKKVDYIVGDYDVRATDALQELYNSNIKTSHLQKLFSVGMLGVKTDRKLVPTRWSITAVDDILSKELLKKIKTYSEINEISVFHDEYNGNHYEIILLPGEFKFEVIEIETTEEGRWQDYEDFFGRKKYADSVTGAYYANRLAVCEYLEKIKKQANVVIFRQISEDYYAPLGVGILRELMRRAVKNGPIKFSSIGETLGDIKSRLIIPVEKYSESSWILKNYGKQKKLFDF